MPNPVPIAVSTAPLDRSYVRADIELLGVDHSGSSYEGRVYVNNREANDQTERSAEHGYAGSYYVFGHGGCLGDVGHCDVQERDPFDPRPGHPLTRARKVVIATEALREAVNGEEITITIVPVVLSTGPKSGDDDDIVDVESVRIVTYR